MLLFDNEHAFGKFFSTQMKFDDHQSDCFRDAHCSEMLSEEISMQSSRYTIKIIEYRCLSDSSALIVFPPIYIANYSVLKLILCLITPIFKTFRLINN